MLLLLYFVANTLLVIYTNRTRQFNSSHLNKRADKHAVCTNENPVGCLLAAIWHIQASFDTNLLWDFQIRLRERFRIGFSQLLWNLDG